MDEGLILFSSVETLAEIGTQVKTGKVRWMA